MNYIPNPHPDDEVRGRSEAALVDGTTAGVRPVEATRLVDGTTAGVRPIEATRLVDGVRTVQATRLRLSRQFLPAPGDSRTLMKWSVNETCRNTQQ